LTVEEAALFGGRDDLYWLATLPRPTLARVAPAALVAQPDGLDLSVLVVDSNPPEVMEDAVHYSPSSRRSLLALRSALLRL